MTATVSLPNGMIVSCLQKHEVSLVHLEVEGYLCNGLRLKPGDTVFDVGANIGLFSLAAYEHCKRDLSIYAFEPVAAICDVLRVNIARNTVNGQVQVLPFGLWHRGETVSVTYYPRAPVLSTAYPDKEADLHMVEDIVLNNIIHLPEAPLAVRCLRRIPKALRAPIVRMALAGALRTKTVTCQMRTLSQFVADRGIERIDLLKIDVEKAELDVLLGIEDKHWGKVRQVAVEVHDLGGRLKKITALLRQKGLKQITVSQPPTLVSSNIFNVFASCLPAHAGAD